MAVYDSSSNNENNNDSDDVYTRLGFFVLPPVEHINLLHEPSPQHQFAVRTQIALLSKLEEDGNIKALREIGVDILVSYDYYILYLKQMLKYHMIQFEEYLGE